MIKSRIFAFAKTSIPIVGSSRNRTSGLYSKAAAKIEIQLQFITHDTFPSMLKQGSLDLVYTLNPYIELPELIMLHKKPETLGFYASPEYPLASRNHIKETDLENIPLLLTSHSLIGNDAAMYLDN